MQALNHLPCTSGKLPASVGYESVGNRTPLQALLDRAVTVTGLEKQEIAKRLGVSPPWFSRLFNGKAVAGSLGPEGCFKLAALIGESPLVVLRAADKAPLADLIAAHFGARARPPQTPARPVDPLVAAVDVIVASGDPEDVAMLRRMVGTMTPAAATSAGRTARGRAARRPA